MRAFFGSLISIPYLFVIAGIAVFLAFTQTFFNAENLSQRVLPDSYNSATLLVAEHFSGADRSMTTVVVDRVRALITPEEYIDLTQTLFAEGQRAIEAGAQNNSTVTLNLKPVKEKLLVLAGKASARVGVCTDEEVTKKMTLLCIPRQFSADDSRQKFNETMGLLIDKEIPSETTYTIAPDLSPVTTESTQTSATQVREAYSQLREFTVGAYHFHQGLTLALFVVFLTYILIQIIIQYSFSRVLFFVGGLLIADALFLKVILSGATQFPTYVGMTQELSYATEHFLRFMMNEPLPVLKNISIVFLLIGAVLIGCGVLYRRQQSMRASEKTL